MSKESPSGARLGGKVAVITGASRGIGAATASLFAREGADIVVNYRTSKSRAEQVVSSIRRLGRETLLCQADVADASQVADMFKAVLDRFGRVDILVNNAGMSKPMPLAEITPEIWRNVIDVNLGGAFLCSQAVASVMTMQKHGAIVNVSSVSGMNGKLTKPGNIPFVAAKHGILGLTRALAIALSPYVRVNSVVPGVILTEHHYNLPTTRRKMLYDLSLLKRAGSVDEVAKAILFLASEDSSFVTGQCLLVDGGIYFN